MADTSRERTGPRRQTCRAQSVAFAKAYPDYFFTSDAKCSALDLG